jgi:hypothetical protein
LQGKKAALFALTRLKTRLHALHGTLDQTLLQIDQNTQSIEIELDRFVYIIHLKPLGLIEDGALQHG